MAAPTRLRHSALGQLAERQMRMWALGLDVLERRDEENAESSRTAPLKPTFPYVCVSRETGALGEEVAQSLARQLGWELLDRELIHYIAERGHLSETMLQYVDERRWNWLMEVFGGWIQQRSTSQEDYLLRLGEVLLTATRHAPSVIVGRGAQFLLAPEHVLAVRIVAPRHVRVRNLMVEHGFNEHDAGSYLDRTDAMRDEFVRHFFHRDAREAHLYDLVINTGTIYPDASAALIAAECRRRFPAAQPVSATGAK